MPPVCPKAAGAPNCAPPAGFPVSGAFGVAAGGAAHGEADLPKADVLPKAGVLLCPKAGFAGVWAGAGVDAPKALVAVLAGVGICCCTV